MSEQIKGFEERASRFRKDTGFMAPGKDLPKGTDYNEYSIRLELWKMWHELEQLEAERERLISMERVVNVARDAVWHDPCIPSGEIQHKRLDLAVIEYDNEYPAALSEEEQEWVCPKCNNTGIRMDLEGGTVGCNCEEQEGYPASEIK